MASEIDRHSYPGLITSAADLWRKWLGFYEHDFSKFDYNVHVGQGIAAPGYLTPDEAALWKQLTQKKIDVVAERYQESWIFEIAERPGLREVGQIIGYGHLAAAYLKLNGTVSFGVICARLGHDMAMIFKNEGILVFFFPPAGAPSFPPTFMPTAAPPAAAS